jgi:hypothetical protein
MWWWMDLIKLDIYGWILFWNCEFGNDEWTSFLVNKKWNFTFKSLYMNNELNCIINNTS